MNDREGFFECRVPISDNIPQKKNIYIQNFLKSDKKYLFLIEENCKVLNEEIYQKFIDCYQKTGIHCLMWYGGSPNRQVEFYDDPNIDYWSDFSPAFAFYTREALEKAGLMDEKMPANTYQELEHAKRIGDLGLSTPFGMFASPKGTEKMLRVEGFRRINNLEAKKALDYWESKDEDEFPISVREDFIEPDIITEMI